MRSNIKWGAIKSAVDYIDLELGEDRAATDLYRGTYEGDVDVGRSKVVSMWRHGPTDSALPHANVFWLEVINFAPFSRRPPYG